MTEALKILPYELIADDGSANMFTGVKFVNPDQGRRDRGIVAVRQARSTRNMQHPGADCAVAACCAWENEPSYGWSRLVPIGAKDGLPGDRQVATVQADLTRLSRVMHGRTVWWVGSKVQVLQLSE